MGEFEFEFDFERLIVYQKAVDFSDQVFTISSKFSSEIRFSLGDQLRRAALSVCNNIAEGSRKQGKAKLQFYSYALDSTRECIPMLTLAIRQKQITAEQELSLRDQCVQLSRMLYKLLLVST